jgi:hypothetical protein
MNCQAKFHTTKKNPMDYKLIISLITKQKTFSKVIAKHYTRFQKSNTNAASFNQLLILKTTNLIFNPWTKL